MSPSQEERDSLQPPPRTEAEIAAENAALGRLRELTTKVKKLEPAEDDYWGEVDRAEIRSLDAALITDALIQRACDAYVKSVAVPLRASPDDQENGDDVAANPMLPSGIVGEGASSAGGESGLPHRAFSAPSVETAADTERLDFLEAQMPSLGVDVFANGGKKFTGRTWREAIDAARRVPTAPPSEKP